MRRPLIFRLLSFLLVIFWPIAGLSVAVLSNDQALAAQKEGRLLGSLSIRVVDRTGNPLEALVVVQGVSGWAGRTNGSGYYSASVPAGKYMISAIYRDHRSAPQHVKVVAGRAKRVTIVLRVAGSSRPSASNGSAGPGQPIAQSASPSHDAPVAGTPPNESGQGSAPARRATPAPGTASSQMPPATKPPAAAPTQPPAAAPTQPPAPPAELPPTNPPAPEPTPAPVQPPPSPPTPAPPPPLPPTPPPPPPASKPAEIKALTAEPTVTEPGGTSHITAVVVNPDNVPLTFSWKASGGNVTGADSQAFWVAPQSTGEFTISVIAKDNGGRTASGAISVNVRANAPAPTPVPPPPLPLTPGTRDPATWPFDKMSPWNYPIGSGAVYEPIKLARTGRGFTRGFINGEYYTVAIWVASPSDPIRKIYRRERNMAYFQRRIPNAAVPSKGTDAHMIVISPDHLTAFEMFGARKRADGDWEVSGAAVDVNLKGMGINLPGGSGLTDGFVIAYGGSAMGGVIRTGELRNGIKHALQFMTSPKMWNRNAPGGRPYVWPASSADSYATQPEPGGFGSSGNLYMGSLVAIPPSVNINAMGLVTPEGRIIARALQDYGAYGVDSTDAGDGLVFRLDYSAMLAGDIAGMLPNWTQFLRDLDRIATHLQVVVNSHNAGSQPAVPGGGGTPRTPLAPDFLIGQGRLILTIAGYLGLRRPALTLWKKKKRRDA